MSVELVQQKGGRREKEEYLTAAIFLPWILRAGCEAEGPPDSTEITFPKVGRRDSTPRQARRLWMDI